MKHANRQLVWLGYGCAILSLLFGGNNVQFVIAVGLGIAGAAIGIIVTLRGRPLNGAAIIITSVIFAYLGATEFRQGLVEGFEQGYQSAHHAAQGQ